MGIDYGMGKTNIDLETGIRYGVIPMLEVMQAWADESGPDYGEPSCPECGDILESWDEILKQVQELLGLKADDHVDSIVVNDEGIDVEYWCKSRGKGYTSDDDIYPDSPISCHYFCDGYVADQSGDMSDILISKSDYYTWCDYCSPCAPGAGYLLQSSNSSCEDVAADCKAYCFSHDWFEDSKAPYRVYRVSDDTEVLPEGK